MGRPPIAPGSWGAIHFTSRPDGQVRARGRFRDAGGAQPSSWSPPTTTGACSYASFVTIATPVGRDVADVVLDAELVEEAGHHRALPACRLGEEGDGHLKGLSRGGQWPSSSQPTYSAV